MSKSWRMFCILPPDSDIQRPLQWYLDWSCPVLFILTILNCGRAHWLQHMALEELCWKQTEQCKLSCTPDGTPLTLRRPDKCLRLLWLLIILAVYLYRSDWSSTQKHSSLLCVSDNSPSYWTTMPHQNWAQNGRISSIALADYHAGKFPSSWTTAAVHKVLFMRIREPDQTGCGKLLL